VVVNVAGRSVVTKEPSTSRNAPTLAARHERLLEPERMSFNT
jgi:hypothetical protein